MPETTEQVPFRLALPDGTTTGDLTDDEAARLVARHPAAVLITHVGDVDEARRAQQVQQIACDLRRDEVDQVQRLAQQREDVLAELVRSQTEAAQTRVDLDRARARIAELEAGVHAMREAQCGCLGGLGSDS